MDRISAWLPRRRGRIPSLARLNARRIAWLIAGFLLVLWGGGARAQSCPTGQSPQYVAIGGGCNVYSCPSSCFEEKQPSWSQLVVAFEECAPQGALTQYATGTYYAKFASSFLPGPAAPTFDGPPVTLSKIGTRYRTSDNLEFGSSPSYGQAVFQARYICATDDEPEEECPPAGTPVPSIVGGLCIGGGCDTSGMCAEITDTGALGQYNGNHCAADRVKGVSVDGAVSGQYVFTGETCADDVRNLPQSNEDQEGVPEGCARNESTGVTVCLTDTDDDCGTVNGDAFCAKDVPTNGCKNTSQGGRLCDKNAPTPPKPNKGTPGDEADEDGEVTGEGGNQYYYYNAVTVGNSNGGENDGDGDGEENCTDGEGNSIPCGQPSECDEMTGDCTGAVRGPGFTAKTFGQSLAQFSEDVQGSGVGQLFGSAAASMPAGSCPALNLDLFFGNVSTNAHCELAAELTVLSSVFIAIYVFLGIRIIGSA